MYKNFLFYLRYDCEEVFILPSLQKQVIQSLDGLSDDGLEFILDMIQRFVKPAENQLMEAETQKKGRKLYQAPIRFADYALAFL